MNRNDIELAAHKVAIELQRSKIAELQEELARKPKALEAYPVQQNGHQVWKAGPNPILLRDAVLAAIQKALTQRLKKFFQDLQLQALRILRLASGAAEAAYWDEIKADAELIQIINGAIAEAGQAAFNVASKEFGVAVAWTADNFWLPQYVGLRADLIKGIDANLKAELIAQLKEGYAQGEGIPKLSQRVSDVFRGMIDWKAERISRTETIQAYGAASLAAYQAGGILKVRMHDGPHDDKANCIDVDGIVVSIPEASQLMAEEHPNGVRGVAPFMENLLMPTPNVMASAPYDGVIKMAEATQKTTTDLIGAVLKIQEQSLAQQKLQQEQLMALIRLVAERPEPEINIDLPPPSQPSPNSVTFGEGAFKGLIESGAIKVETPVNFQEKAFEGMARIEEGAIKIDTPFNVHEGAFAANTHIDPGAVQVEVTPTFAEGAIKNQTTLNVPEPPDVVIEYSKKDGKAVQVK